MTPKTKVDRMAAEMRDRSLERLLEHVDHVIALSCKRPRKKWRAKLDAALWDLFNERDHHQSCGGQRIATTSASRPGRPQASMSVSSRRAQ